VLVGGRDVANEDVIALRRGIGYVIQETGLFPNMTVLENVGLPLKLGAELAGGMEERRQRVEQGLEAVGLDLRQFGNRYPWQLSGGQRQRAGVARALVHDPGVLLMDEPFGALDPLTRAEMQTMLRELLRRLGKTTILVTHDLDEALYLADEVVLMEQGSLVAEMAAKDVRSSANEAMLAYVQATHRGDAA
jgi:osmoprotectant transport system ATP-binding protein